MRTGCRLWLVWLWVFTSQGCSIFTSYPDNIESPLQNFEAGNFKASFEEVEERSRKGLNRLVYQLEAAMVLHTEGDLERSNEIFSQSEETIRQYEEKAVISVSDAAAQGASLFVNEKTIPYQGEPFEKVLINTYKGLNYVFLRKQEEARVEIRRSFARQQENRKRNEEEIERLEEEARDRRIQTRAVLREVESHYGDQQEILTRVKNPYEDPFAYYLSALVYELNGEFNDAYVDLQRVQELRPGVPCVENDLLRMAKASGLNEAYRSWSESLNRAARFANREQEGEIIIFFQCGMAPRKEELKLALPIPEVGLISLALPKYRTVPSRIARAALYGSDGTLKGETSILTDLEAIAMRNLDDRMSILLLKQVLRSATKGALAMTAGDQGGAAAMIAVDLFNLVTEQADLRCWTTLPGSFQVTRLPLQQGRQDLVLIFQDSWGRRLQEEPFSLEVKPGEKTFVHVRTGTQGVIAFHVF
jgi:hypothetical protein